MRFAIWSVYLAIRDFAFFKYCFYCKSSSLKGISYLLLYTSKYMKVHIFELRRMISSYYYMFVNRARDPLYDPHKYSPQRCEQIWIQAYLVKKQRTEPYCIIQCSDDNATLISPNMQTCLDELGTLADDELSKEKHDA